MHGGKSNACYGKHKLEIKKKKNLFQKSTGPSHLKFSEFFNPFIQWHPDGILIELHKTLEITL